MTRLNPKSSNRGVLVIATLIAVVLIAVVAFAVRPGGSANSKSFDLSSQPLLGQDSAKVTMVVFEDFKCPNCKNFEDTTMPVLQSKYIDTGKVKMYKLNFPFIGPDSTTAAEAAECVFLQKGSAGYNQYSTLLFRAQQDEQTVWATPSKLEELGGYVDGLDVAKLKTCIDSAATKPQVDADTAQANKAGVTGTPSVYVNGVLETNYSPDSLSKVLDKALQ